VTLPTGYNAAKNTPNASMNKYLQNQSTQYSHVSNAVVRKLTNLSQPQGEPPSSSLISCCNTMEYTLAFSRVKTVAVLRSRPRNESRISTEGFAASSARIPESYNDVSVWSVDRFVKRKKQCTLSRLPTNLAYSSRTSCSSGLSSGSFSCA
jgi:hypothetical protein